MLSMLFLIPALSLAGMPPLSGFFAKLALIQAGMKTEQYAIVATALVVGLLTLFSMTKIWAEAFWKPFPATNGQPGISPLPWKEQCWLLLPIGMLAATTVAIGLGAEFVFELAVKAAEQLLHPNEYIQAVLGESP
jgi:multicomponent Na+:H+ antiporter subunit D